MKRLASLTENGLILMFAALWLYNSPARLVWLTTFVFTLISFAVEDYIQWTFRRLEIQTRANNGDDTFRKE